jgi:hypothetical protein
LSPEQIVTELLDGFGLARAEMSCIETWADLNPFNLGAYLGPLRNAASDIGLQAERQRRFGRHLKNRAFCAHLETSRLKQIVMKQLYVNQHATEASRRLDESVSDRGDAPQKTGDESPGAISSPLPAVGDDPLSTSPVEATDFSLGAPDRNSSSGASAAAPTPIGSVDHLSHNFIAGWAWDKHRPSESVSLIITDNDRHLQGVLANCFRKDLEVAGIGDGRHGFECALSPPLTPHERHVIRVFNEVDGRDINWTELILEPSFSFGAIERHYIEGLASALDNPADIARAVECLESAATALRQKHAQQIARSLEPPVPQELKT